MLRWKDSCRFNDLHGATVLAMVRADTLFADAGLDCWVTSVNDSAHMTGSKHYTGRAFDLRVHHIAEESARVQLARKLGAALGPQYTVLYEGAGTPNAHIHVQFNGL